jgi:hypothetical protein
VLFVLLTSSLHYSLFICSIDKCIADTIDQPESFGKHSIPTSKQTKPTQKHETRHVMVLHDQKESFNNLPHRLLRSVLKRSKHDVRVRKSQDLTPGSMICFQHLFQLSNINRLLRYTTHCYPLINLYHCSKYEYAMIYNIIISRS